jgi:putative membrane protein
VIVSGTRLHAVLAAACGAVWLWAAIAPLDRFAWLLENLLVFAAVGLLWRIDRERPLSDAAHGLIAAFFVLHVIGAHYTYSETPIGDWLRAAFALDRNHYDRVVHFAFGLLLARPIHELVVRRSGTRGAAALLFTATIVAACSELYELIEWAIASIVSPQAALAWLGTQGDPFDAQKDSGLALAGALLSLSVIWLHGRLRARG